MLSKSLIWLIVFLGVTASSSSAVAVQSGDTKSGEQPGTSPQIVRLEPTAPIRIELPKASPQPQWTYWVPSILSGLLTLLGAMLGLRIAQRNTTRSVSGTLRANEATNWQKANETELRSIEEKLEKFYGPLMTRLQADHLLAQDIRNRQPKGYRLLMYLFNPEWVASLSEGDRKLVAAICEHAVKLEEMIINAGSVDPLLIPYFSRAVAHFRILGLAHQQLLGSNFELFKRYVYPKPLDKILILEIRRLSARAEELRASPASPLRPIKPLIIPKTSVYKLDDWPDPDGRILNSERWRDEVEDFPQESSSEISG